MAQPTSPAPPTVLAVSCGPRYCGCRSTEDRRSPSNRLKVREFPAAHAGGRGRPSSARADALHAPTASCVGAFVISGPRRSQRILVRTVKVPKEVCMARADKSTAVADIAEQFRASTASVITEYRGLSVANLAELRRSLAGSATYSVAKNTLIRRAASEAGIEGLDELFVGPTAIAFVSGEAVDAAKAIKTFAKDHKALVIKGGYMD